MFVSPASKFLQVSPTGSVPLAPPLADFAGDGLTVALSSGAGQVIFAASSPNTPPARTELLQKLPSPRRSPTAFYKSQAFAIFVAGSLAHAIPVEAAWYAGAYRFVNADTGQMTDLVTLGVVEVT